MAKKDWKRECEILGQQIIDRLDEPEMYEPNVHSNGVYRFMSIYHKRRHDSVWFMQAPTYYDLYVALQSALSVITVVERGF